MFLIGIAGGSGSGKTTFAKKLIPEADHNISILHMDSYYLPLDEIPSELKKDGASINFDHPKAFDWQLLRKHLTMLKNGEAIPVPDYDFKTSSRTEKTHLINPAKVHLFEGIFTLMDKDIREMLDIKVYLHVEADIRFTRRLHRDTQERNRTVDSVIEQYYATVRPMYKEFLEPQRQYADFIVGEETDVAASILGAKIQQICANTANSTEIFQ